MSTVAHDIIIKIHSSSITSNTNMQGGSHACVGRAMVGWVCGTKFSDTSNQN